MSSSVGHSVEEIAAASSCPKGFQLYVPKDRAVARRLVERAERAGYKAIVLTVDLGERKDADRRHQFTLPQNVLLKHLRDVGFDVTDHIIYEQLLAFNDEAWDLTLSWNAFDWLRSITKPPLLIKGVLRADDAPRFDDNYLGDWGARSLGTAGTASATDCPVSFAGPASGFTYATVA